MARRAIAGVLLDLDGVVYVGDEAVPGAADAVAWLQREDVPHRFLTNTTSKPRSAVVHKLARFGVHTDVEHVWSPPAALARWLAGQPRGPVALFAPADLAEELSTVERLPPEAETGARYVVVGDLGAAWRFEVLNRAFRLLMADAEAVLVALGMTRYWRAEDGLRLDVAPFVAALREATERPPVVLGKPDAAFFATAASDLGLDADQLLMVGDDVAADVGGAQGAGLGAALVRTGKFRPADLAAAVCPDAVLDSVADLPALLRPGRA